jgi:hypothetical protein
MSLDIAWEHHARYGVLRLSGSPTLGQFLSCLEIIAVETTAWDHGNLLVDLLGIRTLTSFTDQFAIGEQSALKLAHLRKVASVVPPGRLTRNSERPARSKGLDLRVFTSEAEALDWLLKP